MDWADGYFTDLEYVHGYYRELNPAMLRIACLAAGIQPPPAANPVYLELGFGQGVSINMHAAASDGDYWGTDFNPAQAAHAAMLSAASGANASLFDESFEEFAARDDLPVFDIIALHGIWSWVSEKNRGFILEIIRKNLRAGGIVYISYNCFPGWAAPMPIRHLMAQHMALAGSDHLGPAAKINEALGYVQKVAGSGAFYFAANPSVSAHIQQMNGHSRNYLAHEYFNRDWNIMHFSDVAVCLQGAKLGFAGSARLLDHIDEYNMIPSAQSLLAEVTHPMLRQTVRDYIVNQQFRMDIFTRGAPRLVGLEVRHAWYQERFTLIVPAATISMTHKSSTGELTLDEKIYGPLIDCLAERNYAAKTVEEICDASRLAAFDIRQIVSALLMMTGLGYAQPAQTPDAGQRDRCRALNLHLCQRSLSSGEISTLASPILGGGKAVAQEHQMVILAMIAGLSDPLDQAIYLNGIFAENGGHLNREGKPVRMGDEAIGQFRAIAEKFRNDGHVQLLSALGVLPETRENQPHGLTFGTSPLLTDSPALRL